MAGIATPDPAEQPDPAPRPKRRTFTAEYKLRIVAEYDAAPSGEKGAILRRATQLVCADAAACCARTLHTDRWALVGAAVPVGEPKMGAALLRCQTCDVPATAGELSIPRSPSASLPMPGELLRERSSS